MIDHLHLSVFTDSPRPSLRYELAAELREVIKYYRSDGPAHPGDNLLADRPRDRHPTASAVTVIPAARAKFYRVRVV